VNQTAALSESARFVSCPICGKQVAWTAESFWRPFCSKRCKLGDLGAWAAEEYRVAGSEPPSDAVD